MLDAIVIGAGPAGIAAARTLSAAGRSVEVLEARARVGGRVVTTEIAGRAVDLGAHWLHMVEHNPLSALALQAGVTVTPAPTDYPVYDRGKRVEGARLSAMHQAWARADKAIARVEREGGDRSIADYLPDLGEWTDTLAGNLSLYCGAPLEELSAEDYDRNIDGGNKFIVGGYGALIAALARPLIVRLNCPATAIRTANHVVVESAAGPIEARAAIVTAPVALLATEAIRFEPRLPGAIIAAIESFRAGVYEHALLRWPNSPFDANGANRLTFLKGDRGKAGALLTCIEGSDLHYFELGAPHRAFWGDGSDHAKRAFVREVLAQFGAAADAVEILCITDWLNDPWSLSAWSVCPPGAALARDTLRDFRERNIRFASEATSPTQPNTVGGAWLEGVRAADSVMKSFA